MQESASLVEVGSRKGYSELHRGEGNTFLEIGTCFVECADRPPACRIIGALFQLINNFRGNIILDRHLIGRHIALGFAIKVNLAHLKRVFL